MKNYMFYHPVALTRGFTLIELLVVIAIIGMLSSIVLASLNSARNKGNDTAIKQNLANMRAEAELVYDSYTSNCYGDGTNTCNPAAYLAAVCTGAGASNTIFTNPVVTGLLTAAGNAFAAGTGKASVYCVSTAGQKAWAAAVALKAVSGSSWCVDSTGVSKQEAFTGTNNFTGATCK